MVGNIVRSGCSGSKGYYWLGNGGGETSVCRHVTVVTITALERSTHTTECCTS